MAAVAHHSRRMTVAARRKLYLMKNRKPARNAAPLDVSKIQHIPTASRVADRPSSNRLMRRPCVNRAIGDTTLIRA